MGVPHLFNIEPAEKTGCSALAKWVDSEYAYFCAFISSQGSTNNRFPQPDLQITSWGKRDNSDGAHGKNLAIDISRLSTLSPSVQISYICLFGLWLQSKNNNLCHVAISSWNKHIHIDVLPERKNKNTMEITYKSSDNKDHYDFKPIDYKLIYQQYLITSKSMPDYLQPLYLMAETIRTGKSQTALDPAADAIKQAAGTAKLIFSIAIGVFILSLFRKGK